jgi:hypothetical protein
MPEFWILALSSPTVCCREMEPRVALLGLRGRLSPRFVAHVDVRLTMVRRPQDSPVTVSTLQPMR